MRLQNKIAIVTGASTGIGRAIALALAKEGAHVVVTYNTNEEGAKKTVEEIEALGRKAHAVKCDVRSSSDIDNVVQKTLEKFESIDILCNNAGVSTMNWVINLTEEEFDYNMNVNAKGVFLFSKAVAKQMIKQGGGKIVNIASISGRSGHELLAHYCASKAACISLTQSFAKYLAKYKINVNAVCPGLVKTSMQKREIRWTAQFTGKSPEEVRKGYLKRTPLGRLEEPEDVAKVVVFLCSDEAGFITGQAINVDGGVQMPV